MQNISKKIILGIILIVTVISLAGCANINTEIQEKAEIEECQHEWVTTSRYDWIFESYKTISKCSKCGKEI